ncbi:MAG: ATP-binding protein, partial [Chitinophagaceae bacterium]
MNYSEIVFGKSLEELSMETLTHFFIIPQGETATLEFKSFSKQSTFDKNIDGIIKGLCAFLNSDGGILIWG